MENIFGRIPVLGDAIFNQLPDQKLVESYQVSKTWESFIKNQKLPWIRMMKKHIGNIDEHPETWEKVVRKTPVEIVKEMAISVHKFGTTFPTKIAENQLAPLYVAAGTGTLNLYKYILEKFEYKSHKTKKGNAPYHVAAYYGQMDICKFIVENMEDKNPASNDGWTPLHIAAQNGHIEICKLIVENVEHKNPARNNGTTPLYICLLYTSPSPRDGLLSRMPSSA